MKLVRVSILVFLTAATSLVILKFSLPPDHDLLGFLSHRVFLFSVFHIIFFAIFAESFKPSTDEFAAPFFHFGYEEEEYQMKERPHDDDGSNHRSNCDYSDDNGGYYYGSDGGYEEENDDEGSEDEIGWVSDEESDDLESRIDEFIKNVITGWREELLRENLYNHNME